MFLRFQDFFMIHTGEIKNHEWPTWQERYHNSTNSSKLYAKMWIMYKQNLEPDILVGVLNDFMNVVYLDEKIQYDNAY